MQSLQGSLLHSYDVRQVHRFKRTSAYDTLADTEIDWETYMVQTETFLKGQHNYSMITGPTGPLV